jgi:AraC family transcriptional regulator of adaptative response/methylated-DNA-[protein]-cysteine methyltransferase
MDETTYWKAVEARDAAFDGAFVFGVVTTKIYCRPSCSAKRAKRENVRFFDDLAAAEEHGFRSCLRCKPRAAAGRATSELVREIRSDSEIPAAVKVGQLAYREGVTPAHFQRKLKGETGVSPKRYEESGRIERFKKELNDGSEVTDAIYAAGYSSSSRIYERVGEKLGMTPAVYKKGGEGISIAYTVTDCEFGRMLAARTERGVCSVTFGYSEQDLEAALRSEFPNAEIERDDSGLAGVVKEVVARLSGIRTGVNLPLDVRATAFQILVWDELGKIPYGETRSYTQVAERLGDRKKVRAVARACATNSVAILIPCHRVVASDGGLAGYRWGIERKRGLLDREKAGSEPEPADR